MTTTDGQGSANPASDQWAHLAQLAADATEGPWEAVRGDTLWHVTVNGDDDMWVASSDRADARFIAACDPPTILRLVAQLADVTRRGEALAAALTRATGDGIPRSAATAALREWRENEYIKEQS